jgi:hypothetical protein
MWPSLAHSRIYTCPLINRNFELAPICVFDEISPCRVDPIPPIIYYPYVPRDNYNTPYLFKSQHVAIYLPLAWRDISRQKQQLNIRNEQGACP